MDTTVANALSAINFGEVQNSGAISVFPLVQLENTGPFYLTLSEAIRNNILIITEISEGGSVPTLMVENKGDIPVLLLDGEELSGAKQNRVLNTSVLVPPKSNIHAPVSCTEHGRWRYQSGAFSESGYRMSQKMNAKKSASVSRNLKDSMCYESDQCMVWNEIDKFSREKGVHSDTGAMKDVHDREKPVLDEYLKKFPWVPGQHGVLVIINGEIAGFDMLSRNEAYEKLHSKFIASYAIDADNSRETKRKE